MGSMKRIACRGLAVWAAVFGTVVVQGALAAPPNEERGMTRVTPETTEELLVNPGRGWVLYGRADGFVEQARDALALGSIGYARFHWADLNPAEGKYDWSKVETFLEGWSKLGKRGAFGVMAASSHSRQPFVTPEWVFEAGAACKQTEVTSNDHGRKGRKVVPDFDHPVFFAKLEKFLEAFAERYDGDPRIEFIDIRSYGNWGEAHMGHLGGYPMIDDDQFQKHVKLHVDAFEKTQLILPLNDDNRHYPDVAKWAVQQGVGVRRDGVIGNSDGSETAIALGKQPAVFEYYGSYERLKGSGMWDGTYNRPGYGHPLAGCVERGKPTYMQFGWWGAKGANTFLENERALMEKLHNRMGYCFHVAEADLPERIRPAKPAKLTLRIANRGVAPIYIDAHPVVALLDGDGKVVARAGVDGLDPAAWAPDKTTEQTGSFTFANVGAGAYRLALGLFTDLDDESPAIAMPLEGRTDDRWHPLATVTVTE